MPAVEPENVIDPSPLSYPFQAWQDGFGAQRSLGMIVIYLRVLIDLLPNFLMDHPSIDLHVLLP